MIFMKTKILYVLVVLLTLSSAFLIVYTITSNHNILSKINELECDRIHLYEEVKLGEGLVPDEETAIEIANIIIRKQSEISGFIFDEERDYNVEVTFDEKTSEWFVYYYPVEEGKWILDGGRGIKIRHDNGAMTGIWLG